MITFSLMREAYSNALPHQKNTPQYHRGQKPGRAPAAPAVFEVNAGVPHGEAADDKAGGEHRGSRNIKVTGRVGSAWRGRVIDSVSTISSIKKTASDATKSSIASLVLFMRCLPHEKVALQQPGCFSDSSRSHKGLMLRTGGIRSKLWGGGGEDVAHSRVQPPQGLSPAGFPLKRLRPD